jgi:hypothetical protein
MQAPKSVWVFLGNKGRFPSGVFQELSSAEEWISRNFLSGLLTKYWVGEGVYDWAVRLGHFIPSAPEHRTPEFVATFSSATLSHHHYQDGVREA